MCFVLGVCFLCIVLVMCFVWIVLVIVRFVYIVLSCALS